MGPLSNIFVIANDSCAAHYFFERIAFCNNYRSATGHRFERREAEAFVYRRHGKYSGTGI